MVCKHDITPNSPLNPFNIELAKLVHKGEQVSIIAAHDNLTVSMDGVAMDEGALGDSVKVKIFPQNELLKLKSQERKP